MDPRKRAALAEIVQILANGLRRNLEPLRQIVDGYPADRPRQFHYFRLPSWNGHRRPIRTPDGNKQRRRADASTYFRI